MTSWLAIDYGSQRIGVAVGNMQTGIASPLEVIPAQPLRQALQKITTLASEYSVAGIVVGWPLNMDDTEGPQGKLVRQVARELSQVCRLDVRLWDERLSSFQADQELAGMFTRKKKKQRQDAHAAAAILKDFIASNGPSVAVRPSDVPNNA